VSFWDERSVGDRYAEGETRKIVTTQKPDAKMLEVSGGPLLREIMAEDREESIMGRTFVLSHTGTARDTSYKFREVKTPNQAPIVKHVDEEDDDLGQPEAEAIPDVEEQEKVAKDKFDTEVKKRTKARKAKKVEESPEIAEAVTSDAP
jgi:hypothetical protein